MYYIGTYDQANYYQTKVCKGENYHGDTVKWAPLIQSLTDPLKYAILKHINYSHSNMATSQTLPAEFIPNAN